MPTYLYRTKSGKIVERFMTMRELGERQGPDGTIRENGQVLRRVYSKPGLTGCESNPGWPIHSEAAGFLSDDDVQWAKDHDRQHGVPTQYDSDHRPIFTDSQHRKRYLKAHGYTDRSGFN